MSTFTSKQVHTSLSLGQARRRRSIHDFVVDELLECLSAEWLLAFANVVEVEELRWDRIGCWFVRLVMVWSEVLRGER